MEKLKCFCHWRAHASQNLYADLCSKENIELAFKKARKGKTLKWYVIEFENNLESNLQNLQKELKSLTYHPKPLQTFILRDPKTRKISKSDFRDRVVHHAICNIIEPLFEKCFITDSYANRKGKGTFKAIEKFEHFARQVSNNFIHPCYILKADIKHYFDTVDHKVLCSILEKKIKDKNIQNLIKVILKNHKTQQDGKGMPLGNLTSQFLANVYLNQLDQFVKHKLKAKHYIRYVDDFVILHHDKQTLQYFKQRINQFCNQNLALQLHPDKSKILQLQNGVGFLGFHLYSRHKRIKKKNVKRFERKLCRFKKELQKEKITREKVVESFEGWLAHISHANTFKYRKHLIRMFNHLFPLGEPIQKHNLAKHQNFLNKSNESNLQFSVQKTLKFYKENKSVTEIANLRDIKISTVWDHFANLIEYNQLSVWKLLSTDKVKIILSAINSENDKLKEIKSRLNNISYNEINCVLAYVKSKNRSKNVLYHINWHQKVHCLRKCYFNKKQRKDCFDKFNKFVSCNTNLTMKRKEFIDLFNNHLNICVLPEKEKKTYLSWKQFKMIKHSVMGKKEDVTPLSTKP